MRVLRVSERDMGDMSAFSALVALAVAFFLPRSGVMTYAPAPNAPKEESRRLCVRVTLISSDSQCGSVGLGLPM